MACCMWRRLMMIMTRSWSSDSNPAAEANPEFLTGHETIDHLRGIDHDRIFVLDRSY